MPEPSIPALIARVLVITVLATLLTFAAFLFLGIAGFALAEMIRGGGLNLANAYRLVALPGAAVGFVVAFCASLWAEVRHYRRACAGVDRRQRFGAA